MSLALVGLRRPGVIVRDPQVVAKSWPGFWDVLDDLIAQV
jgi:3-phosphoshikimate 1-carboxyvinyltransferase